MKIRIMRILEDTTADGPGWRTSVYAAGCRHACPGCHNPETWPMSAGEELTVDEVFQRLQVTEGGITFSGGDPLYQAPAFTALARRIKTELYRNIWCYTGFLYEEVEADAQMSQILPYIDVLVDGPFVQTLRDTNLLFRGSSNQRLIDVQASLETGRPVLLDYNPYPLF